MIPVSFKYKVYPHSKKATGYSKACGIFFAFVPMVMWSFMFVAILSYIMEMFGMVYETGMIISLFLLIPFIWILRKIKKYLDAKIELIAIKDYENINNYHCRNNFE